MNLDDVSKGMFVYVENGHDYKTARYHVPVRVSNKVITLWVAPTACRFFTRDNLPDYIKQKLAIVSASGTPKHSDWLDLELRENKMLRSGAYHSSYNECPDEFKDIGWRVNDKYYYIVLTEGEILPLITQSEEWVES